MEDVLSVVVVLAVLLAPSTISALKDNTAVCGGNQSGCPDLNRGPLVLSA
jgi:hypothetical protein